MEIGTLTHREVPFSLSCLLEERGNRDQGRRSFHIASHRSFMARSGALNGFDSMRCGIGIKAGRKSR